MPGHVPVVTNYGVLLPVLLLLVVLGYIVFETAPRLARDRLIRECSELRSLLWSLDGEDSPVREVGAFQWADRELAAIIATGRVMGIRHLATALVVVQRQQRKRSLVGRAARAAQASAARDDSLDRLSNLEVFALQSIVIAATRRVVRAVLLGSRFWFITWIGYVYLDRKLQGWGTALPVVAAQERESVREMATVGEALFAREMQPA